MYYQKLKPVPYRGKELIKVELIEKKSGEFSSEFILKGEDHTIANALCRELRLSEHVVFAGYRLPHPLSKEVVIIVKTDGRVAPREALLRASDTLKRSFETFSEML